MMQERTLLTVDWDAFIPEPLEADRQHQESLLHRNVLWQIGSRDWLRGVMELSDFADPPRFWSHVAIPSDSPRYISDSHLVGAEICRDHRINKVVIVDQHHDLWPWHTDDPNVHCGNWLTAAIAMFGIQEVVWYAPEFSHCIPEEGEDFCGEWLEEHGTTLSIKSMEEFEALQHEPTVVHVCRSSCWTPPWLDHKFREFVSPLQPFTVSDLGGDDWNPLDIRPGLQSDPAYQQLLANSDGEAARKGLAELKARCLDWIRECGEHTNLFPPEGE